MAGGDAAPPLRLCRLCGRWKAQKKLRGVCWKCYRTPDTTEPTAEEVDRTVAEQYACLPEWWFAECVRVARGERAD